MSYYNEAYYREPFECTTKDNQFITPFPAKCVIPQCGLSENKTTEILNSLDNLNSEPDLNLAGLSAVSMEPDAVRIMAENLGKNYSNQILYDATEMLEENSASMIIDLFNGNMGVCSAGVSTQGSEEAIYLAGLNYKFLWQRKYGECCDLIPEIIIGSNAHISWFKFAQYFGVKPIIIPVGEDLTLDVKKVEKYLRKNTICVVGTLGDSYTGRFDDIELLNAVVDKFNNCTKCDIPIHVDAANGGFIVPLYTPFKDIIWDFSLRWVRSINVSSHEYGFVFPGLGWILWKDRCEIDPKLIFEDFYYGERSFDISINYSRNASNISAQYYLFTRYGKRGYDKIDTYIYNVRDIIIDGLDDICIEGEKIFDILKPVPGIPIIAFEPTEFAKCRGLHFRELIDRIRRFGWSIGANELPEPYRDKRVFRIAINIGFTKGLAGAFIRDIRKTAEEIICGDFYEEVE